jgi:hypothetical protein
MADAARQDDVKTIVVPRALEDFFASRLSERYAGRPDIRVVVDRRGSEAAGGRPVERRVRTGWWSLPDMPFETTA